MNTRRRLVFFILYDEQLPALASAVRTYGSKRLNPVNDHDLSVVILSVRSYLTNVLSARSPSNENCLRFLRCGISTRNSETMIKSLLQES
jgi:hypothetical protein